MGTPCVSGTTMIGDRVDANSAAEKLRLLGERVSASGRLVNPDSQRRGFVLEALVTPVISNTGGSKYMPLNAAPEQ